MSTPVPPRARVARVPCACVGPGCLARRRGTDPQLRPPACLMPLRPVPRARPGLNPFEVPVPLQPASRLAAVAWEATPPVIIDQRRLPDDLVHWRLDTVDAVVEAIRTLAVRGAPAIGIAGAYGVVDGAAAIGDGPGRADRACESSTAGGAHRRRAADRGQPRAGRRARGRVPRCRAGRRRAIRDGSAGRGTGHRRRGPRPRCAAIGRATAVALARARAGS